MIPRILGLLTAALLLVPGAARAIDIQEVTSPGGIDAWLVEDASIPFVAIEIWFNGGASLDAPGKRGAIHLMTGLLEEGAEDMDARAFAEEVEGLAASFEFDVYRDALTVSARMLTENREAAADLLRAALVAPRFDEDAVERVRGQVLSIIDGDARDPDEIAGQTFNALAWGDHPYGSALEGTRESVGALTRESSGSWTRPRSTASPRARWSNARPRGEGTGGKRARCRRARIEVAIADGGKTLIRVTTTMAAAWRPDDLPLALSRHATSKIDGTDLLNIHSASASGARRCPRSAPWGG
jgi:hypothetical protein